MTSLSDNTTVMTIETWFISIDILMIITTTLSIILGIIFLLIIVTHKTCWSVPMLLTANSGLNEVLFSYVLLIVAIVMYQCDLTNNTENVSLCIVGGFLCYVTAPLQNYSYLQTAIYRYTSVVYPARIGWLSAKSQLFLIIGTWIFAILFPLPLLLTKQIVHNIDNQICQVPLGFTLPYIYVAVVLYITPNLGIVIIYIKLARYVRQISNRVASNQTLFHAKRELKLLQRTFILASTLIILGIPYLIFALISFFTIPPTYHLRIAYVFIDFSLLSIMIMLFYFTQPVREFIQKLFRIGTAVEPVGFPVVTRK